ncbi:MAG TPA: hypothetical protein P5230_00490 [Candidatus Magasanikbacteria bacterium]|nr:hypothetical protein [Candidatus Magasanikbacteria bacterium]
MLENNSLNLAIKKLFEAQDILHSVFPKKPFTPDGRIVGDIGEAIAEIYYCVEVDNKLRKDWDGTRTDLLDLEYREVQIKATTKEETYLKKPPHEGILLVFKIHENGQWNCVYNGSIMAVWDSLNHKKDINGKIISFKELAKISSGKIKAVKERK